MFEKFWVIGQMAELDRLYKELVRTSRNPYHRNIKKRILYSWNKISHFISKTDLVVEIGVGPISVLAKQIGGAKVIGIDIDNSQSTLCSRFGIELHICNVETSQLPIRDNSVDVIFLLEVIEHLCMYPKNLFDELYKKLKNNGILIVSSVNFLRFSNRIRVLLGKSPLINHFEQTADGRNHIREFLPSEMSYYMTKSGFRTIGQYLFGISKDRSVTSTLLNLTYLYPSFRNYFLIIGKK
jgi:2-polyprenyl-3-methyl-5-hydroxy-6-metoxy-1,4-benzoquinol methylase